MSHFLSWSRFVIMLGLAVGQFAIHAAEVAAPVQLPSVVSSSPSPTEGSSAHDVAVLRYLPEVLIFDGQTDRVENGELIAALNTYGSQTTIHDVSPLLDFLSTHPQSPWKIALLTNIALTERSEGYFSRSMQHFADAWAAGKKSSNSKLKPLVDRALGEYAITLAWIGRFQELDALFAEVGSRSLVGVGGDKLAAARLGRMAMREMPENSFKCGPYAIQSLAQKLKADPSLNDVIEQFPSTVRGTSMVQVRDLARQVGMQMKGIRRARGSALPVPSVIHWRLGHFSALIDQDGDRVQIQDRTLDSFDGDRRWIARSALDEEADAYLVQQESLQAGWTSLSDEQMGEIWGRGDTGPVHPPSIPCDTCRGGNAGGCKGMANYRMAMTGIGLIVQDTPLSYQPPNGLGVDITFSYLEQDVWQPATFTGSNIGTKWSMNWISYIQDDAQKTVTGQTVVWYMPQGGARNFSYDSRGRSSPDPFTGNILVRNSRDSYTLYTPDNFTYEYNESDGGLGAGRRLYLSQIYGPNGFLVFKYENVNGGVRLISIVSTVIGGPELTAMNISYRTDDALKIDKITDQFGRTALLTYNASGVLASITDPMKIVSSFGYESGTDLMTSMTTPYGTTTFTRGAGATNYQIWLQATDPQGDTERSEFVINAPGVTDSEPVVPSVPGALSWTNMYLVYRNSYFWDKKQMKKAAGDYLAATNYHWLHVNAVGGGSSRILESVKKPLEGRVWFQYPGQGSSAFDGGITCSQPSITARVLEDGTTQVSRATYTANGQPITMTDPLGRVTAMQYDGDNRLIEVDQYLAPNSASPTRLLFNEYGTTSYYSPKTITDAAGNVTNIVYDNFNHPLSITNAKNEKTQFVYDVNGYLTSVIEPNTDTTRITYDVAGRIGTVTNPDGSFFTREYDDLDRIVKTTYSDGTYEQVVWDRLDPGQVRSRSGKWTQYYYNALRQLVGVRDPAGGVTAFEWCKCGQLQKMLDPLGQATNWTYDIAGHLVSKAYADGKGMNYVYGPRSGRLLTSTDAKGQVATYNYNLDNKLQSIVYSNAAVSTPRVDFTYDALFGRLSSMTDSSGTTSYGYYPITTPPAAFTPGAGLLASISGPLPNSTITFAYDQLNRVQSKTYAGGAPEVVNYDKAGRISGFTDGLGSFGCAYDGASGRLATMTYPNGMVMRRDYLAIDQGKYLSAIRYLKAGGAPLTSHQYGYDASLNLSTWSIAHDGQSSASWNFAYDDLSQLISSKRATGSGLPAVAQDFGYDAVGNRTTSQSNGASVTSWNYNALNELQTGAAGGEIRVTGSLNRAGTVTITGKPAVVDAKNLTFSGTATVTPGENAISIKATPIESGGLPVMSSIWQMTNVTGSTWTRTYDANGNTLNDLARTYTWDAADRLVAIVNGTHRTEFVYDGISRRVKTTEIEAGVTQSVTDFVWLGGSILEERTQKGAVTVNRRYFPQGEIEGTTKRFYTRDHLGSIRDVVDVAGNLIARYDYTAFGARKTISAAPGYVCSFGFTSHYIHVPTGLCLTWFRAYDANAGRWLSRDPIGERGGVNLYAYVHNAPLVAVDPWGLDTLIIVGGNESAEPCEQDFFEKKAKVAANIYSALGPVVIVRPRSLDELKAAFSDNKNIKHILYFGHGGFDGERGMMHISMLPGQGNVSGSDIASLDTSNVIPGGNIQLQSCRSGAGEEKSLAQAWANAFKKRAMGYPRKISYNLRDDTPTEPGSIVPAQGVWFQPK